MKKLHQFLRQNSNKRPVRIAADVRSAGIGEGSVVLTLQFLRCFIETNLKISNNLFAVRRLFLFVVFWLVHNWAAHMLGKNCTVDIDFPAP